MRNLIPFGFFGFVMKVPPKVPVKIGGQNSVFFAQFVWLYILLWRIVL
jgi:hypothetical protein